MKPSVLIFRRLQWASVLAAFLAAAALAQPAPAFARDGESGGGQSGGGSRSDESDNGGSTGTRSTDDGKDDSDDGDDSAKTATSTSATDGSSGGASTGAGMGLSISTTPDEGGDDKGELDQEDVRAAVLSGAIMPLAKVLPVAQQAVVGSVIDITLVENVSGSWIYEIGVMNDDGVYKDVIIDAKNSRLLAVRNR